MKVIQYINAAPNYLLGETSITSFDDESNNKDVVTSVMPVGYTMYKNNKFYLFLSELCESRCVSGKGSEILSLNMFYSPDFIELFNKKLCAVLPM
jgi:hypothetical protein